MRQIGSVASENVAERFIDFLKTIDVSAQTEEDTGNWLIWVRDENQVDVAREELSKFEAAPEAEKYRLAREQAHVIRSEEAKQRIEASKNLHQVRDNWSESAWKRAPIVCGLILTCIVLPLIGGGFRQDTIVNRYLMFVDLGSNAYRSTGDAFISIRKGQLWRTITPAFLHDGLLHLIFNLYWVYVLGTQIEPKVGRWKFARLILAAAIIPNLMQATVVGPHFLGISGIVFALFGYIFVRKKDGYQLSEFVIAIFAIFFILDFTPFARDTVAVWAHAGGLATGAFIGYLPDLMSGARRSA